MEEGLFSYLNNQYNAGYKVNPDNVVPTQPTTMGNGIGLSGLGTIAGGAGDLIGAFTGYKQYKLEKDAFNFNKDMKEKEYAMAKDAYDRNVARANSIGSQMQAGRVG